MERFGRVDRFAFKHDNIRLHFSRRFIVKAQYVLAAGVGNFFRIIAQLDFRYKFTALILSDQLKHAAQRRTVLGGDQMRADAPGIDGASLQF